MVGAWRSATDRQAAKFWREEIQNRNRLLDLAGRNSTRGQIRPGLGMFDGQTRDGIVANVRRTEPSDVAF